MQKFLDTIDISQMSLEDLKKHQSAVRNLIFELRSFLAINTATIIDFLGNSFDISSMSVPEINSAIKDCLNLYHKLTSKINSKQ